MIFSEFLNILPEPLNVVNSKNHPPNIPRQIIWKFNHNNVLIYFYINIYDNGDIECLNWKRSEVDRIKSLFLLNVSLNDILDKLPESIQEIVLFNINLFNGKEAFIK